MLLHALDRAAGSAKNAQVCKHYLPRLFTLRCPRRGYLTDEQANDHRDRKHRQHTPRKQRPGIPFQTFRHLLPRTDGNRPQNATVTRREGAAFRRLRALSTPEEIRVKERIQQPSNTHSLSRSSPLSALDALLDDLQGEVVRQADSNADGKAKSAAGAQASRAQNHKRSTASKPPQAADGILSARRQWRLNQNNAYRRASWAIKTADSDSQIWDLLQQEVFEPVAELRLEEPKILVSDFPDVNKEQNFDMSVTQIDPLETIGANFAQILCFAASTLRKNFPTSPLPVLVIKELRRLGPTYYALGVTTELYNHALEYVTVQDQDLSGGLDLLDEMDREVIEPDRQTLAILSRVVHEARKVLKGEYGHGARIVRQTERHQTAYKEIRYRASILESMYSTTEQRHSKQPTNGDATMKDNSKSSDETNST